MEYSYGALIWRFLTQALTTGHRPDERETEGNVSAGISYVIRSPETLIGFIDSAACEFAESIVSVDFVREN